MRPNDRVAADRAAMMPLPPVPPEVGWRKSLRLPRDHYVRLDSNDYSVHPGVIGRRIEVHADPDRVWVTCDGAIVADHQRVWAQHQTITELEHSVAAKLLRHGRADLLRPVADAVTGEEVEIRSLGVYDTVLGLDGAGRGGRLMATRRAKSGRDVASELEFLTRALKAPALRESASRLAERAREDGWTHEEFLAACLQREVAAREAHGGEGRILPRGSQDARAWRTSTTTTPAA